MTTEEYGITEQKSKMIDMLLKGCNIKETAEACGVSRPTIYAWKKEPVVKAELELRRSDNKKTAQDKIMAHVPICIDNMYAMANQKTDQRVRFQANKFIIEMGLGKATAAVDKNINDTSTDAGKDTNTLKKELDDIKNLKVVK